MEKSKGSSHSDFCEDSQVKVAGNADEKTDSNAEEFDPELDELLDESLADFTTYTTPQKEKKPEPSSANASTTNASSAENSDEAFMRALLGGAMGDSASGEIDDHLKALLQDDPLAMAEFEKLAMPEASSGDDSQKAFADTLAKTLSSLSSNAESLKSEMSEDDILRSFQQSLNMGGAEGQQPSGDFMPMMQNMMSSLLSKDILYPSLKDLADKYPDWLSANNGKLPKKQFDLYTKQFDIVSSLCDHYNFEKPTDTQQIKDERFEKIMDLMNQMQDCGPPPKDIVGELAPGLNFDTDGNPQLPGMEQCAIM